MIKNYSIRSLDSNHSEQALSLVSKEFSAGSPLHRAMNITQQEYFDYLTDNWSSYAFEGPVKPLAAFSNSGEELLGCIIASHFPGRYQFIETLPKKHQPIAALLQALEQQYLQNNTYSGGGLLADLAVVKKDHHDLGIYQQLRAALQKSSAAAGYSTVFGELSSAATQHVCINKLGHEVIAEINYSEFRYSDEMPFACIKEPHSIQLVSSSS